MTVKKIKTPGALQIPVEVVGSSKFGRYHKINSQVTYNMFISDGWLVNFAGYKRVLDLIVGGVGNGRGIFHSVRGGFLLVVVNSRVVRIDQNLIRTEIGNLNTAVGEVFIDENLASQICIVDGREAYIYNHASPPNITVQAGGAFGTGVLIPNYVQFHNSYFLFGNANANNNGSLWYAYEFLAATTIQQANEFALQTKPDYAIAVKRIPGQSAHVLVFGRSVTEIWTQVGGALNYRRQSTINIDNGCVSVSTIAASDNHVFWLGANETNAPVIMVYKDGKADSVSSDGIDFVLQTMTKPGSSTASMFRQDGHLFYLLTFFDPNDNMSLIYDVNEGLFFNLSDHKLDFHPARQIVYFNKTWYFISLNNSSLYETSTDITTVDETLGHAVDVQPDFIYQMQRIRTCNSQKAEDSSRFRVNYFVMTIEQGYSEACTGINFIDYLVMEDDVANIIITEEGDFITDEDSLEALETRICPRVDLSFSKDGGITWSNTLGRLMRTVGNRRNIMTWNNMGSANYFTIRLRFQGVDRFVVNNGLIEVY